MKHINKAAQINVPPSATVNPCSELMNAPQRLSPDPAARSTAPRQRRLALRMARIWELALRIPPARNDVLGTFNSVVGRRVGPLRTAAILPSFAL